MTGAIINSSPDNEVINVEGSQVSMKLVQSIYNEFTGKKESLSRFLTDAHEVTFNDIHQLNSKILQLHEQYNIISNNTSVTVFHVDDCKAQFSSFERFKLYDVGCASPCENIRLEYNFLIVLPNTKTPQSYKIKIDLISRVGLREKELYQSSLPRGIFRMFGVATGNIEIEYVDYTVARNFLVAIQDWHKTIEKNKTAKWVVLLQRNSEHIPFIFNLTGLTFVVASIYSQSEHFIGASPNMQSLFGGFLIAFAAVYFSVFVAHKAGSICEETVDYYSPVSYVCLNKGDEVAIKKYKSSYKKQLLKGGLSLAVAIFVNVFAAYIIGLITR